MSYESFKDMNQLKEKKGRPRSGSPRSVTDIDMLLAANQAASNIENLDIDSFLSNDMTNNPLLNNLKKAMLAYKQDQTEENENEVAEIFDKMIKNNDKNVGKTKIPPRKRYVLNDFKQVFLGKWRHNQTNPLTKEKNPAFFGGKRKKRRKTRKRRRKKRTKKKTRRKRRKSRKRKTKRRRKKKTRKRKAGCWPFCRRRPRVQERLLPQQQEAPTMTDEERIEDYTNRLIETSSGSRSLHTERRHARLAANEAAAKKANNPQGDD
jgi:hypothetical protein